MQISPLSSYSLASILTHSASVSMANSTMLRLSGSILRQPHGKFPTVSINDAGTTVGLHQPFFVSTAIHYQVGIVNGDEVDFSESRLAGKGRFPKVALNNENQVVQVHEGRFVRRIYYNIGVVNNFRINWGHRSQYICWGRFPAVATHDNRIVITYDCAYVRHSTYYCIGTIKSQGRMAIDWGEKRRLFRSAVTETAISISKECAVAVGRGWIRIKYQVGRFREDGSSIEWTNELQFNRIGFCPTICLDNNHYVIMVWQSFTLRQLSYALGVISAHDADQPLSIDWSPSRDYDYGYNPTIALSPNNGHVLEEHETNRASCRCTLHYHTGVLQKKNKEPKEKREEIIGQPPLNKEIGEEQLQREIEEIVADVEQPVRAQGAAEVREETGEEEQPEGEIGVWNRDLRQGRNEISIGQEAIELNLIHH